MLVRIGRDDPAAGGALGREPVGKALHLFRTVDGNLFLRRQSENRPVARVLHRAFHIRVERDLDLDHPRVVGRSRAGLGPPLRHFRQDRFGVKLARLAARADQAVAHPAGIFRDQRAGRRDIDRNGRRGPVVDGRVLGAIILTFERHPLLGPELTHQGDASRKRANRSLNSGQSMPVDGTSFSDSPVPTPSTIRLGNMTPSVAKACATTAG